MRKNRTEQKVHVGQRKTNLTHLWLEFQKKREWVEATLENGQEFIKIDEKYQSTDSINPVNQMGSFLNQPLNGLQGNDILSRQPGFTCDR